MTAQIIDFAASASVLREQRHTKPAGLDLCGERFGVEAPLVVDAVAELINAQDSWLTAGSGYLKGRVSREDVEAARAWMIEKRNELCFALSGVPFAAHIDALQRTAGKEAE